MSETWKNIVGYNGYQVSNMGRVRTHNKITSSKRFGRRVWKDRILQYKVKDEEKAYRTGYAVDLWKNGKPKSYLVCRLVAYTFFDKDINDLSLTVNHIDGNRLNNQLENLEIVSLKDNIRHGFATGLYSTQKKVKLTDKEGGFCEFRSMSEASRYLERNVGYVSAKLKKGEGFVLSSDGEIFKCELV